MSTLIQIRRLDFLLVAFLDFLALLVFLAFLALIDLRFFDAVFLRRPPPVRGGELPPCDGLCVGRLPSGLAGDGLAGVKGPINHRSNALGVSWRAAAPAGATAELLPAPAAGAAAGGLIINVGLAFEAAGILIAGAAAARGPGAPAPPAAAPAPVTVLEPLGPPARDGCLIPCFTSLAARVASLMFGLFLLG